MKTKTVVVTTGWLLVVTLLGARIAWLEQRLACQAKPDVPTRRILTATPSFQATPRAAVPEVEKPLAPDADARAELDAARAELIGLKGKLAELQTTAESSVPTIEPTSLVDLSSGIPVTAVRNERIEHWTGGDKRRWGHEQAAGEPDTDRAGDIPSAWASKAPDDGEEWLQLDYDRIVDLRQINVLESHNPGAIRKVVAVLTNGREMPVWEGTMDPSAVDEVVASEFQVAGQIRARSVKVYLDTTRVAGWNEIDAVQIIGRDGSKQWATASSASSSYADP